VSRPGLLEVKTGVISGLGVGLGEDTARSFVCEGALLLLGARRHALIEQSAPSSTRWGRV
jgi:NADP-dependent 3-hydroxy acid dehydrogenase YdfG